jgi:proteasome assembly chaperone (PAC2) family protein
LDIAQDLGCQLAVSLGGFKKDEVKGVPSVYTAATDEETLKAALSLAPGAKVMVGHIYGIAGIVVGLSRLRDLKSFALLVDTVGMYPDAVGSRVALEILNKYLGLTVNLSEVEATTSLTKKLLESFGLVRNIAEEKKKEEDALRWYV